MSQFCQKELLLIDFPFLYDFLQMSSSLKNIRDSASKRRAEKLEKSNFVGDSLRSSAQSVLSSDSGHYSISTFQDKEEEMKRKDGFSTKV